MHRKIFNEKTYLIIVLFFLLFGNAWAGDENGIMVPELARTSKSWDGAALPGYPEGMPEITVLRITVLPGIKLPLHTHPVTNARFMLEGGLTVTTEDNEVLYLGEGEVVIEVVDKWHYGQNEGDKPAVIVVFYAVTPDKPITISR